MSIRQVLSRTLTTSLSTSHFPLTPAFSSTSLFFDFFSERFALSPLFSFPVFKSFCDFLALAKITPAFPNTSEKPRRYPPYLTHWSPKMERTHLATQIVDPLSLCTHIYKTGRECRQPVASSSSLVCATHLRNRADAAPPPDPLAELASELGQIT